MIQGGYQYRFHSKLNRGFILGVTPYLNGLVGAVLQEYPRADPRYSVFVVKEVADKVDKDHPYQPGVYNLQLASSDSSAQTYLGFPMNYDNMNRGTVADGNQLCCIDTLHYANVATWPAFRMGVGYVDWTYPQHPELQTPSSDGWVKISTIASGSVAEVKDGTVLHNQPVNSAGCNGGDRQQWWAERVG